MSIFTPARRVLSVPAEAAIQVPFIIDRHAGVLPSYATDFAHSASESEYPELWRGLVGFWPIFLGQTGNKVFDLSGNGGTGTITNGIWGPGLFGSIVDLTAGGAKIEIPTSPLYDGTSTISWSIWVYGDVTATDTLIDKYDTGTPSKSYHIDFTATGDILLRISSDGNSAEAQTFASANLSDNTWYHIVITFDSPVAKLYINGVYIESLTYVSHTTIFAGIAPVMIGTGVVGGDSSILVDNFSIYNRALSASEIALLSSNPTALVQLRRRVVMVNIEIGGEIKQLAGTSVIASSVTGELNRDRKIAGTGVIASSVTGELSRDRKIAGTSVISSSVIGELTSPVRELAGTCVISSTVIGELLKLAIKELAGTSVIQSAVTGQIIRVRAFAGIVEISCTAAGELVSPIRALAGTCVIQSTVIGELFRLGVKELAGICAIQSIVTGELVSPLRLLAGRSVIQSIVIGELLSIAAGRTYFTYENGKIVFYVAGVEAMRIKADGTVDIKGTITENAFS